MVIYIVTLNDGSFGNAGSSMRTIDSRKIKLCLASKGQKAVVVKMEDILNYELGPSDVVFYTTSENPGLASYVRDIIYIVQRRARIVPNYAALLATDNKFFQKLFLDDIGFQQLACVTGHDPNALPKNFPYVFKLSAGYGSEAVHLVDSESKRSRIIRKYFSMPALAKAYEWVRYRNKATDVFKYRRRGHRKFVVQDFVQGLDCDYKVLVFGEKIFPLKRGVRPDDFRASGSGKLSFPAPPHEVLDYAKRVFFFLDVPFVSLDITYTNESCALLEFQVLNFGPYALTHSPGYYIKQRGQWAFFKSAAPCLEDIYADALIDYLSVANRSVRSCST